MEATQATAYFGGGCFWCVEAVLERLRGVEDVTSGFMGGGEDVTYEQVCRGGTAAVEVVRVTYDPAQVSYQTLLDVFFATHDPTTRNRQGNDVGTQYRSVLFVVSEDQRAQAQAMIDQLERDQVFERPIVTSIEPASVFVEADAEHQDYYRRNEGNGYCSVIIAPKVAKLRQRFSHLLTEEGKG